MQPLTKKGCLNDLIYRTVRGAKYHTFVNAVKAPGLEFIEVDDVVSGDFTEALKGVDGVIHTACPLPGKKGHEELLSVGIIDSYIKHAQC